MSGIDFIGKELSELEIKTPILVLTKGLKYEKKNKRILTISQLLEKNYKRLNIINLKRTMLSKRVSEKKTNKCYYCKQEFK